MPQQVANSTCVIGFDDRTGGSQPTPIGSYGFREFLLSEIELAGSFKGARQFKDAYVTSAAT
jgi:hypothetical protein